MCELFDRVCNTIGIKSLHAAHRLGHFLFLYKKAWLKAKLSRATTTTCWITHLEVEWGVFRRSYCQNHINLYKLTSKYPKFKSVKLEKSVIFTYAVKVKAFLELPDSQKHQDHHKGRFWKN